VRSDFSFLIKILIVFEWRLIKATYHLAKAEGSYKWPLVGGGGGDCVVDAAETFGVAGSQRSGSKHEQWISEAIFWSGVKLIEENTEKERDEESLSPASVRRNPNSKKKKKTIIF
jgi:hypothetical protein